MEGSDEDEPAGASSQSDQHMTTTSRHHFGNARDSGDAFSITIIEVLLSSQFKHLLLIFA